MEEKRHRRSAIRTIARIHDAPNASPPDKQELFRGPSVVQHVTFANLRIGWACIALLTTGCTERLTKAKAEWLLYEARPFDPVYCPTPLTLTGGIPTDWGGDNPRDFWEVGKCIHMARELGYVRWTIVSADGDPRVFPTCTQPRVTVVLPVPGKATIENGTLSLLCGETQVEVTDIKHHDGIARIFVRETRHAQPLMKSMFRDCSLSDPVETEHNHVMDAYFARGEWHLSKN